MFNKIWYVFVTPLTITVSALHFPVQIMLVLEAIKSHFKKAFDKQNLTFIVIHMKYMKLDEDSFHKLHMQRP